MRDQPSLALVVLLSLFVMTAIFRSAGVEAASRAVPAGESSLSYADLRAVEDETVPVSEHIAEVATEILVEVYPDRIQGREYRHDDWALKVDGRWFYWSEGRLLPYEMRGEADEFAAMRFYEYRVGEHQPPEIPEEFETAMRERAAAGDREPMWLSTGRHPAFYEHLYGFDTAAVADRTMVRTTFLGRGVRVHPVVSGPLAEVEKEISDLLDSDEAVKQYVDNIRSVSGFHWRDIFGSISRSYHAYGIAVDILPRRYDGYGFWRWAQQSGVEEWWSLPLEQRHSVPDAVVDAFERHGFVWGGKWIGFDPVHFEYRPEVIRYAELARYDSTLPSLY